MEKSRKFYFSCPCHLSWTFHEQVGEYVNSTLRIADIQWPGDRSKPPPGKPVIYYLKVVTLQEQPFVMLKDPFPDGKCQPGSVLCRIGPENS